MIKEAMAYSLGEFLFKGARFLLIPFYIKYLPQDQYGILQQIIILTSFCDVVVSLAIKQSMLRLFYEYKTKPEQDRFLGTIFILLISSYTLVWIVSSATPLFKHAFDFPELDVQKIHLILLYSFLFEFLNMGMNYYRIHRQLKNYMVMAALVSISEVGLILLMLFMNQPAAMIRIEGGIIACILGLLWMFFSNRQFWVIPTFDREIAKNYLGFSLPLIVISILGWFIVSFDKIIINASFGPERLAVYGLAIQLASIYKYGQMGFIQALSVSVYEKTDKEGFKNHAKRIGVLSAIVFASVGFIFLFTIFYIGPLLLPPMYTEATKLTMLLIISKILLLYYLFTLTLLKSYKNTTWMLIIYIVSTIIFYLGCNYFIPAYGLFGGVYANIITSLFMFLVGQIVVSWKYGFKLTAIEIIMLIAVIMYATLAIIVPSFEFHVVSAVYIVVLLTIIWMRRDLIPWGKIISKSGRTHKL